MSRIPPELARRVDRLARRAHGFHRWAHHPLCSWYAGDVIRLGRRGRVCLGCTLAGVGAVAGMALGLATPAAPGLSLLAGGLAMLAAVPLVVRAARPPERSYVLRQAQDERGGATRSARAEAHGPLALSVSKGERARTRARKLLTRLLPAAAAGFLLAQPARVPSPARLLAAALAAAAVGWVTVRYRRRGPDRAACAACPQGPPGSRCPGLGPIARRERALSRLAGRWIAAKAALPIPAAAPQATASPPPPPWPPAPPASPPAPARP